MSDKTVIANHEGRMRIWFQLCAALHREKDGDTTQEWAVGIKLHTLKSSLYTSRERSRKRAEMVWADRVKENRG